MRIAITLCAPLFYVTLICCCHCFHRTDATWNAPYFVAIFGNQTVNETVKQTELKGKHSQDDSPWPITFTNRNSTDSNNSWWHFVGPGRAPEIARDWESVDTGTDFNMEVLSFGGDPKEIIKYNEAGKDLNMCRNQTAADNVADCDQRCQQRCNELKPVLTMPRDKNILKVVVTDQKDLGNRRGNVLPYAVNVSVTFSLDPACTWCNETSLNSIRQKIARVDDCHGGPTRECKQDDPTGCCTPLYYLVEFWFEATEEFAYRVTIHVNNTAHLQPITYLYALHPQPPNVIHPPQKWWDSAKTLFPSVCLDLRCTEWYATTQVDGWPVNIPAQPPIAGYKDWESRCRNAGCLFRSGTTAANINTIKFVAEHGYFQRPEQSEAQKISGSEDLTQVRLTVDKLKCRHPVDTQKSGKFQWGWSSSRNESGISMIDKGDSGANRKGAFEDLTWRTSGAAPPGAIVMDPRSWETAACEEKQQVYWQPCPLDKHFWRPDYGSQFPWEIDHLINTIDMSYAGNMKGRTVYTATFSALEPGQYNLTAQLTPPPYGGQPSKPAVLVAVPVPVDVGPGVLSVPDSVMLQPVFTQRQNRDNPHDGPDTSMSVEYTFSVLVQDELKHQRFSTDQMFFRIVREVDRKLLGQSSTAQIMPTNGKGEMINRPVCFATERLKRHLLTSPTPAQRGNGHDHPQQNLSNCEWRVLNVGNPCSEKTAGSYISTYNFTKRGVFRMELWQCGLESLEDCAPDSLNAKVQQYIGMSGLRNTPTPAPVMRDISTYPNYAGMLFSVCPLNSKTTNGKWEDIAGGYVPGANLQTCLCKPGFFGQKGKTCAPCKVGTFTGSRGSPVCQPCSAGTSCSCSNTPAKSCSEAGEPACSTCPACPNDQYQDQRGQEQCKPCPAGFTCKLKNGAVGQAAMTWPVALEGHYVSPYDPTEVHTCMLGAKTPGNEDAHNSNMRGQACPGGNAALASQLKCVINDVTGALTASADELRSSECLDAIGAKCLDGYAGTGMAACSKCCKAEDTDASCPRKPDTRHGNWFLQSVDNQCTPCPKDGPTTLITGACSSASPHVQIACVSDFLTLPPGSRGRWCTADGTHPSEGRRCVETRGPVAGAVDELGEFLSSALYLYSFCPFFLFQILSAFFLNFSLNSVR